MADAEIGLIEMKFNLLPLISAGLTNSIQQLLNASAAHIAETARSLVDEPYPPASLPGEPPHLRTGTLQDSIDFTPNSGPLEALVRASAPYAATLEYGARYLAARPFFFPAAEAELPQIEDALAVLADHLDEYAPGGLP